MLARSASLTLGTGSLKRALNIKSSGYKAGALCQKVCLEEKFESDEGSKKKKSKRLKKQKTRSIFATNELIN